MSDYYTKQDMYAEKFFPVPKVFMTNPYYKKGLTDTEKLAYGILKDRFSLSAKNNWFDKKGRIYFIFSQANLMEIFLLLSNKTASNIKTKLIKLGLLEKKSWGQGKADWLYLKKPIVSDDDIYKIENAESLEAVEACNNYTSKNVENTRQEVQKIHTNDTDFKDTDFKDTDLKDVNKKSLKIIANDFYNEYSIGRWSKQQWNALIEKLTSEIDLMVIKTTPKAYIRGCLNNIAYAHDFKHGKIEFDLEKHNGAVMFYNWLDDVEA